MSKQTFTLSKRQRGFSVLLMAVVLTIVMGIAALIGSRVGLMEQRITGNDIRSREAHEAAQAGLEYGMGWALKANLPMGTIQCKAGSLPSGCPNALSPVTTSTTGEQYGYELTFERTSTSILVRSKALGTSDGSISATVETYIAQVPFGLFESGAPTPPPWVMAGCITTAATGTPDAFILASDSVVASSGTSSSATCLPQGNLSVTLWEDVDENGYKTSSEEGASATFNRGTFSGCPGTNCAWNHAFKMPLDEAKSIAIEANHTFTSSIPCGPASSSKPALYLINNAGPINSGDITGSCSGPGIDATTVGAPGKPIIMIVPSSAGCPKFNGGITIYGIVYYENTTACAANGWGGAKIYGSVIWEGNVDKPNANSEFIEMNYENLGDLNTVFNMGVDYATSIPGTWKDFE